MVAVGLGIEAICRYLGLTQDTLFHLLVRHALPTPHDRPLRAAGKRGWSPEDTRRLIAWRLAGVHPADIGARLGRSVGGVRARCRRLGVPAPPRTALRRHEPALLVEPPLDLFARAFNVSAAVDATHSARAVRIGGAEIWHFPIQGSPSIIIPVAPGAAPVEAELLARPVMPGCVAPPQGSAEIVVVPAAVPPLPAPAPSPATGDLAWVRDRKQWRKSRDVVEALTAPYLGGQHHRKIAERAGITVSKLQSFFHRLEMPRDLSRQHFSEEGNDALGLKRLAESGYHLFACTTSHNFFFRAADETGRRLCRREAVKEGSTRWQVDPGCRKRGQEVCLA